MRRLANYKTGVWIWGVALAAWLAFVLFGLLQPKETWLYDTLHDHDSLAAALTAVLGVSWSWFLQLDYKTSERNRNNDD